MHKLTRWFIHNPVAANLFMVLILAAGAFSLSQIRIEGFPKIPADSITVTTIFSGAHTKQVDEHITQKVERAITGTPGVDRITSTSVEGLSSVTVKMSSGHSLDRLMNDVRTKVASIYNLPRDAENPIITRNEFDLPALIVQIYGTSDQQSLQYIGKTVRETLLAQPEISKLNIWGERQQELSIEVKPMVLQKYNLSLQDIVDRVQSSSLRFKAGSLKTISGNQIAIRADHQAFFLADFTAIPIIDLANGSQLTLNDVAVVKDTLEDDNVSVRFNGHSAIGMEVLIGQKENLLEIAKVVNRVIEEIRPTLPKGIYIEHWADSSDYISERLSLLKTNAIQGLALVFVLLALFLNVRLAFWVALGVPISIMGASALMGLSAVDYSLNDITTFGFIIALGILVDDAVVVGESVFSERKHTPNAIKGTELGVERVATATVYGVLTTIAAFYPMMLIDNAFGKVLASFAGVVIFALAFSLFESKFILPSHLAHTKISPLNGSNFLSKIWKVCQHSAQSGLDTFNEKIYRPTLTWCLEQRYAVLILFVSVAIIGIGLIANGKIRTTFFPQIPGQIITVSMEMDSRAPYNLTLQNAEKIEAVAKTLNLEYQSNYLVETPPIKHILVAVNDTFEVLVYAELSKPEERNNITTQKIVNDWRNKVGELEGADHLVFSGSEETGGGFAIQVFSKEVDLLSPVSDEIIQSLKQQKGVSSIRSTLKSGAPELSMTLKPDARHLGFTTSMLAQQVGHLFGGVEAQRIQRNNQEIKVMVRGAKDARNSINDLMQTQLQSSNGKWVPLLAIADIHSSYSSDYIARRDSKIVNTIFANIDQNVNSASQVWQHLQRHVIPELIQTYPRVDVKGAGEIEEMGEVKGGLVKALIFTCILIYALLAIPLKSYGQPFVIMSVIPFGFVGAAIGHLIADIPLSILSFFGMLALAGVVVNDSLVMITRFNQLRTEMPNEQALVEAGVSRMRPIFLTTITTVAGLMPLLQETSEQAQYLIPAAVSLAYGEIFATLIMLILVPIILQIGIDIKCKLRPSNKAIKSEVVCNQA